MTFLIVGLGNPGLEYSETRHNVGFRVIDLLHKKIGGRMKKPFFHPLFFSDTKNIEHRLILIKPQTYMNRSGMIFPYILKRWPDIERRILVICDNMDLKPGEIRIKQKGSSAGHNGIKSILDFLETEDFIRLYMGVGRPAEGETVVDHVLGLPGEADSAAISSAEARACDAVMSLLDNPLSRIMNEFNRKQT